MFARSALPLLICSLPASAQDAKAQPEEPVRIPAVLDWRRDRGLAIARVDGRDVALQDLAEHLRARYAPDIVERWSDPDGSRDLNSPALPQLLYQYVDLLCLRKEAKAKELPLAELPQLVDTRLAQSFAEYLKNIQEGNGPDLTEAAVEFYRRRHRREQGLKAEIDVLLDLLVPPEYTRSELQQFHVDHGDYFGGQVRVAHIFLSLRDPKTGRLLPAAVRREKGAMARDILRRLEEDAGNFGELARKFSEDSRTAARGGEIEAWIERVNPRLPAPLVRAAWELTDGAVSRPVETFYGIHIVRRLRFVQNRFILFYGKTIDRISRMKSLVDQERFLGDVRKRHQRDLRL